MDSRKIEASAAIAGFAALAVIAAAEVLMILNVSSRHGDALPILARLVKRVMFGH
jgi:hypothetical protein